MRQAGAARRLWGHATLALLLVLWLPARDAHVLACEGQTVRDAAFTHPRDLHLLCVIANGADETAEGICRRLEAWLAGVAQDLNVELIRVVADDPGVDWASFGMPSAPPSFPVVVLVGRSKVDRRSFVIDHWEPAPNADDLACLLDSPVRKVLQRELGRRLAVLVHVAGRETRRSSVNAAIDAVVKRWSALGSPGLAVVRVDRSDPRERLLLTFTGAGRGDRDWVAVVFGRGKFMPPLVGQQITEADLDQHLRTLTEVCTCLRSPGTLGVDVPMSWEEALDASVVRLGGGADAGTGGASGTSGSEGRLAALEGPVLPAALWTLAVVALVVGGAAGALVWVRRRRARESSAG